MQYLRTLLALSLVLAAVPAPASAGSDSAKCFPSGGHQFEIGSGDPHISLVLHASLFPGLLEALDFTEPSNASSVNATGTANYTAVGALGMEAVGTATNHSIVTLQAGVLFGGVTDPSAFLSDPFAAFSYVLEYRLRLPMFADAGGDPLEHTAEDPISGPVERVDC
jgi:hypothetical protein